MRFDGEPLRDDARSLERHVQIVFRDPMGALNPRQTVDVGASGA